MKIFTLITLLALTLAVDVPADHDKIHFVYSDPHVILGVDTNTVKQTGDVVSFVGIIYYNPLIIKDGDSNATSGKTEIDCKQNKSRILTGNDVWYDTKTGKVLKTTPEVLAESEKGWTDVDPESFMEPMAAYLCHRVQKSLKPHLTGDGAVDI